MTKHLVLLALAACASKPAPAPQPAGLQMKLVTIYVDDQDKALRFYTDVLGFAKKADVTNGPYRWLTVTSPAAPDGVELQLAAATDPAANAFQDAMFAQGQPAVMLSTADVNADYARIKGRGATFKQPPTDVTYATIAIVDDTCGNLVQLTQLDN